jgi:hypothetical protein
LFTVRSRHFCEPPAFGRLATRAPASTLATRPE